MIFDIRGEGYEKLNMHCMRDDYLVAEFAMEYNDTKKYAGE